MLQNSTKKHGLAFRIRVAILVLVGLFVLTQAGRVRRHALLEGILQSHSPNPALVHDLLRSTPEPGPVIEQIWNTDKLPHRWEIINFLNRNLGQRPELVPVVSNVLRQAAVDPDLTTRLSAINLLRLIEHDDWESGVRTALNDPDPITRETVQAILQQAGDVATRLAEADAPAALPRGPRFGDLVFRDFKGGEVPLSRFTKQPVLLHFFATWSPDCKKEIPSLIELRKIAPTNLAILGVSVDGVPGVRHEHTDHDHNHENCQADCCPAPSTDVFKTVERHVIINGYNFPVLFDLDGLATARLEGSELPVHVLLDANGALARRYTGTRTAAEHDGIARALLGDGTAAAPTAKPADITNPPPDEPRICN